MIEGREVRLEVWDTSGQERYRTVTKSYFDRAMGVVLVYDCTDERSFSDIRNWVKQLENHAREDIARILVSNKTDLAERKIDADTGKALAEELNMDFIEASAKLNVNVDKAFNTIAQQILKKDMPGPEKPGATTLKKSGVPKATKPGCC